METVLYDERPAMFRNHPVQFVLGCLTCVVIIGIPFMLTWWIRCLGTRLTVTSERTTLRRGILSKFTNDVMHDNVRNIQISQTFLQRIFNVGTVGISSAGQSGLEIEVRGIPDPERIRQIIDEHRED